MNNRWAQDNRYQLLLVDDEASVVDSLADTLDWSSIGIETVYKASSAKEALEVLGSHAVDILVTDIRMPGMSGLELIAEVRKGWKRIVCLLLSGHAEFEYARSAMSHDVYDYLLKPVSDQELLTKVGGAVEHLRQARDEARLYQQLAQAFQENLPTLRGELLSELLQGRPYLPERLREKLETLKLTLAQDEPFMLMLIRLEGRMSELDFYSVSLMEYAVLNMASEVFEDGCELWPCKSVHGYLVILVRLDGRSMADGLDAAAARMRQRATQLQLSVEHYLQGMVSVLLSPWGAFPRDIQSRYEDVLLALRRSVGSQSGLVIQVGDELEQPPVRPLHRLYEPPLLVHLLESGSWEQAEHKLAAIWTELREQDAESPEHLTEVFFAVYAAFSGFAHKNGRTLTEMLGAELSDVAGLAACRSSAALQSWMLRACAQLRQSMDRETRNDREHAVQRIQTFIRSRLTEDVSLQAIADHMYMHPVHVSRVYKLETGDNISDYVLRLKMELAASLLADPSLKNYEIALRLGYQNPNYFNKVFKRYYALTPQEYRQTLDPAAERK
ncbi:DNA-binding response regulator [Paenibacillus sp. 598K]|uniref:response regulator transcription factor n=1 Tax=Paenibacillus sp. 598K TaxID=1117987 RepID=UPI000FFA550E|nr:response regulator [Paenibacillus sp. 598K]GBF74170.1 DNA-binding response regulator [Paenibacillus sp. 598K]